jgi:hypothetical protein
MERLFPTNLLDPSGSSHQAIPYNGGDEQSRARSFPNDRLIVVVMFVAVRFVAGMTFVLTEILFWIFIEGCLAAR